jgi:hypothetical protein
MSTNKHFNPSLKARPLPQGYFQISHHPTPGQPLPVLGQQQTPNCVIQRATLLRGQVEREASGNQGAGGAGSEKSLWSERLQATEGTALMKDRSCCGKAGEKVEGWSLE